jgi:hypothetical protein
VSLINAALPITLSTSAGPMLLDIDVPLSAVRVNVTVTGNLQIDSSVYKFSLSGTLFP